MNRFVIVLFFCISGKTSLHAERNYRPSTSEYPQFLYNNICRYDQFQCDSLQCIPEENQCDGIEDCRDGSDEMECERIPITRFQCDSTQCIPEEDQCDGKEDCSDGSDETSNCMIIPCNTRYLFQCSYGACISRKLICDGKADCTDSSDESPRLCNGLATTTQRFPDGQCSLNQFRCSSGQCLDERLMCDGKTDCFDNSDETMRLCGKIICPGFTFRCNYGACVRLNAQCNGYRDCADGSDEDLCPASTVTSTIAPPIRSLCTIPKNPPNGSYSNSGQTVTINRQNFAASLSILIANCNEGFKNDPPESFYSICRDGIWTPNPPTCSRSCPSLNLRSNSRVRCKSGSKLLQSCDNAVEGVTAIVACVTSRSNTSVPENCTFVCNNGKWEIVVNFPIPNEFSLSSNKTLSFNVAFYPD